MSSEEKNMRADLGFAETSERWEQSGISIDLKGSLGTLLSVCVKRFRGSTTLNTLATLLTSHVETGERLCVYGKGSKLFDPDGSKEQLGEYIVHEILSILEHDLRECLTIDGEKVFDPHRPGAKLGLWSCDPEEWYRRNREEEKRT